VTVPGTRAYRPDVGVVMADEPRDDELARLLAVEPLDELTRRRLVRTALEATPADATAADDADAPAADEPARRPAPWRVLAAAAVVLVVLVVGTVVLAGAGDDHGTEVANRPDQRAQPQAESSAGPAAPSAAATADSAGAASGTSAGAVVVPASLGDVGDLRDAAARAHLLAAVDALPASTDAKAGAPAAATAATATPATQEPLGCRVDDTGDLVATATGTYGAHPAAVIVTRRDDGRLRVRVVTADPCTVRTLR